MSNPHLEVPEFLAVGHVTHDLVNGEIRPGGAALYSALTAHRLGKRTAVLTSHAEDYVGGRVLEGISRQLVRSPRTSTFRNLYETGRRSQFVYSSAEPLGTHHLPEAWRGAGVVYLCPVLHEIPPAAGWGRADALVGLAPQGWLRQWDQQGRIEGRRWKGFEAFLGTARFLIASEQDLAGMESLIGEFRRLVPVVVVTKAEQGAVIYTPGKTFVFGVYPATERDPTGAGDCFGAAFLIRYRETGGDLREAGRFASCVASFVVEKEGTEGIPFRDEVSRRMQSHTIPCQESPEQDGSPG